MKDVPFTPKYRKERSTMSPEKAVEKVVEGLKELPKNDLQKINDKLNETIAE